MAELSLPPPPPPQPSKSKSKGKGKGAKDWVPKSNPNPNLQGSIPIPTWFKPYGAGENCYGLIPYGYGYQCVSFRPAQPQPQPQLQRLMHGYLNGFVENIGKVDVLQDQTTLFGLVRRGTGVFHPLRVPVVRNNKPTSNRGKRNKKGAEVTYRPRRSKNTSKGNDAPVKPEECHEQTPSSEMGLGLPKEWTY